MAKHNKFKKMYSLYLSGMSLSEVGESFGVTRQSVYAGFERRGYKLRSINQQPYQVYDGIKFTRRNHGYYAATTGDRQLMHRYVWEKYNGTIPKGYDIHHIDRNRVNNCISNLELYSKGEHARKFATGRNQYSDKPGKSKKIS